MSVRHTTSAVALAPPPAAHPAARRSTAARSAGPLSWSAGRRVAWAAASCGVLWAAVLWALA